MLKYCSKRWQVFEPGPFLVLGVAVKVLDEELTEGALRAVGALNLSHIDTLGRFGVGHGAREPAGLVNSDATRTVASKRYPEGLPTFDAAK